jgi:hypothetical protein
LDPARRLGALEEDVLVRLGALRDDISMVEPGTPATVTVLGQSPEGWLWLECNLRFCTEYYARAWPDGAVAYYVAHNEAKTLVPIVSCRRGRRGEYVVVLAGSDEAFLADGGEHVYVTGRQGVAWRPFNEVKGETCQVRTQN